MGYRGNFAAYQQIKQDVNLMNWKLHSNKNIQEGYRKTEECVGPMKHEPGLSSLLELKS